MGKNQKHPDHRWLCNKIYVLSTGLALWKKESVSNTSKIYTPIDYQL